MGLKRTKLKMRGHRCVVLDLDKTLVHSTAEEHAEYKRFWVSTGLWVHVRPGAEQLIQALAAAPDVRMVVWTAALPEYANEVVRGLLRLCGLKRHAISCTFTREHTVYMGARMYVKDLRRLKQWLSVDDVVLVDDDPLHKVFNEDAVRLVAAFDATLPKETSSSLDSVRFELTSRSRRDEQTPVVRYVFTCPTPGKVVRMQSPA